MKKLALAALMAASIAGTAMAEEPTLVKSLFTSADGQTVTWSNTLTIPAEEFADATIQAGNYLYITFSATTDVIELKSNGEKLPGTVFTRLGEGRTDLKVYFTEDMISAVKANGVELCGASFSVTGVGIYSDGTTAPAGAVWCGYFWVENWNTIEIFKEAFNKYNGERYLDIYLSDEANYNTYLIKVLTSWKNGGLVADNDKIEHKAGLATLDLKANGINLTSVLTTDRLMIQMNPEGGNPFNIRAVALRNDGETGVAEIAAVDSEVVNVYNMQGVVVARGVNKATATEGLPSGLYIVGDKKVLVK